MFGSEELSLSIILLVVSMKLIDSRRAVGCVMCEELITDNIKMPAGKRGRERERAGQRLREINRQTQTDRCDS